MEESPRERAISSEPCSARPAPFDEVTEQTSRKRQRTSGGGSRSRSVDTARESELLSTSMLLREDGPKAEPQQLPSTPPPMADHPPVEPTSSRVTINLRTNHPLESIPSSPPSPTTPSKLPHGGDNYNTRISVESESDALSIAPAVETHSSSPSQRGSPQVEFIEQDDAEFEADPPVAAIINSDDEEDHVYDDPILKFPYHVDGETLLSTVTHVARFLQYEAVENDETFCKVRDWIDSFLELNISIELFHDSYVRHLEFWHKLPDIIWGLSLRSRWFGEFLRRDADGRQALTDMLSQFARLAGKFIAMDVRTLRNYTRDPHADQDPKLASPYYISAFSHLLRKDDPSFNHIGRNLEIHYQWNFDEDISLLCDSFQIEGGDIVALTKLIQYQLRLVPRSLKSIDVFTDCCRIVDHLVGDCIRNLRSRELHDEGAVDAARQKIMQGYEFFKIMSPGLHAIIEKHVTMLLPEAAKCILKSLATILEHSILVDNSIARDFSGDTDQESSLPKKLWPKVVSVEWSFGVLKQLITSSQMQLRVVGVTEMCAILLALHGSYKGHDVTSSTILLHFADFILANKLVDYLVGIGSHPEIINESSNILGFLIVTKTYKQPQTDKIWQTVMTSQDPRVVEAILRMLIRCFNLFEQKNLLYLCKQADKIPIEAFSPTMREFCSKLFAELSSKPYMIASPDVYSAPYDICIRLLRESSIVSPDCPGGNSELQQFAGAKLRELLQSGSRAETRNEIYQSCIADISENSPTATGSICVMHVLLRQNLATDLHFLTAQHGLTKLLVEELETAISNDLIVQSEPIKVSHATGARRDLIFYIIMHEPGTITPELGTRLWNVLVGNKKRTAAERTLWWQALNNVLKKSPKNVYLSVCIREHLATLPSECFVTGALDFACEAVYLWLDEVQGSFVEEDKDFESYALEQIWRMILTSPAKCIEAPAIAILVEIYVDSNLIKSLPQKKARSIHLAFVNRCLSQLKGAANKLKEYSGGTFAGSEESMVIVASDSQVQEQDNIFGRSLAVLRGFLAAYQQKTVFATPRPRPAILPVVDATENVDGQSMIIKYQSFDGDKSTEVKSFTLSGQNTAASLLANLQKCTGFTDYKVYCGGQEFDPSETEICKSLDELNLNGLFLVRRREDGSGVPGQSNNGKTTLELEIMKHFDDLWSYLSMDQKVAQEVYSFLTGFPVYGQLLQKFDADTPHSEIFPTGVPFISLYAVHAIRQYIAVRSPKASPDEAVLRRAILLIVAAISDPEVLRDCATEDLKNQLASDLIECLVNLLTRPVLPASIAEILDETLLNRLLQLLYEAKTMETSHNSVKVTGAAFQALLGASMNNVDLWHKLVSRLRTTPMLQQLILEDPRPLIRKSIVKQIVDKCNSSNSLAQVSSTNFVAALWPMVAALVPEVSKHPRQSEELLHVALTLFKKLADIAPGDLKLDELVRQWGTLLLSHQCVEEIGCVESIDVVANGLTSLLAKAVSIVKVAGQSLSYSSLGTQLFRKHLFPDLSTDSELDDDLTSPTIPLLHHSTRKSLSETVLSLVKTDKDQYTAVLGILQSVVPHDTESTGGTPYVYDMAYAFERVKSIRSSTGYVGLKNLSNTCYLNSLFTQLFMNLPFREFMLQAHVADGGASQRLLAETQKLFSFMQNSYKRYVDPTNLASSIRTYEETQIDVTIQMDVDEFYNLLFDRWESQILAPDAKQRFRSFYGGQLVQQVKSKECSHISERLEPFSAIQCDIKGKSSLQESLQAYVDGEIMEGDNKYKCSTCDRHVDAVKRACLKDIPDNLIFHLKRFDFNLRTLQRSKINDHFTFPDKIDMKPYKVEHLMDSPEETPEDIFELVGVLVHSGTAESGHYYSFIRERPSNASKDSWVEFNDESVTAWDPSCMEGSCFGGVDYRGPADGGNMHYDKSWSAYMLFYQRSTVVAQQKAMLDGSGKLSPVRLPVPRAVSNHIAFENEMLMRRYCLFDPSHLSFVMNMLGNAKEFKRGKKGGCSGSHELEKMAFDVALHHLDQVIARAKDIPDFEAFMSQREEICETCPRCSRDYLRWFCDYPETLRHLLLRNPDGRVRKDIGESISQALIKVKDKPPNAYGLDNIETREDDTPVFAGLVTALSSLWDMFHTSIRAWPEYFGLLADIATLGKHEAVYLLDEGFLRRALDLISADMALTPDTQYLKMLNILSKRLVNRPVSYEEVIELLSRLIEVCDPSANIHRSMRSRSEMLNAGRPILLTEPESLLFAQHWTSTNSHILTEKLLFQNQNWKATKKILIKLLTWPDSIDTNIFQAISHGIRRANSSGHCLSFLRAAGVYCEHSQAPKALFSMMNQISKVAHNLDNNDGRVFLDFFRMMYRETTTPPRMNKEDTVKFLLEQISIWGPALLTYYDPTVRTEAEDLILEVLITPFNDTEAEHDDKSEHAPMYSAAVQRLGNACVTYLHETYIRGRQTAIRATLLTIHSVIEECGKAFDPDMGNAASREFFSNKHTVISTLKKYLVEEADEEVSEWDASDIDVDEYENSSPEHIGDILDVLPVP